MGMFGRVDNDEFLEYQREMEKKLAKMNEELASRATDSDETARAAAERALDSESRVRQLEVSSDLVLKELESYRSQMEGELKAALLLHEDVGLKQTQLSQKVASAVAAFAKLEESQVAVDGMVAEIGEKVTEVNTYLEQSASLPDEVEKAQVLLMESTKTSENILSLLNHSLKRKSDIDDLHKKVFGEEIENEEGKTEHVDGLVDELTSSYEVWSTK